MRIEWSGCWRQMWWVASEVRVNAADTHREEAVTRLYADMGWMPGGHGRRGRIVQDSYGHVTGGSGHLRPDEEKEASESHVFLWMQKHKSANLIYFSP